MFADSINALSRLSSEMAGVSVCPPVALDRGMGLLCRLFELWGQVPAGVLTLTEWLLGDTDDIDKAVADDASSLVSITQRSHRSRVVLDALRADDILTIYNVLQQHHKLYHDICLTVNDMSPKCFRL